ncbi:MAG TPA: hypothetical protein VMV75_09610 [Sulfuricella sp.]|nr:hypothetical protein [Sulfuricella sp.]
MPDRGVSHFWPEPAEFEKPIPDKPAAEFGVAPLTSTTDLHPRSGETLLPVDMRNDFLPGGILAVPAGNEVRGLE